MDNELTPLGHSVVESLDNLDSKYYYQPLFSINDQNLKERGGCPSVQPVQVVQPPARSPRTKTENSAPDPGGRLLKYLIHNQIMEAFNAKNDT